MSTHSERRRSEAGVKDISLPIVVGVNGTSEALGAARWAGALAERLGACLHLLVAAPMAGRGPSEVSTAAILESAEELVRGAHPGLDVTTASTTVPIDEALATASRTAHLVVLGCDDVTATGALLVGSTTLATVAKAGCPIVAWRGSATMPTQHVIVVGVDGSPDDGGALGLAFELADRLDAPLQVVYCWPQHPLSRKDTGPVQIEWDESTQAQWQHLEGLITPWREVHPRVDATLICEPDKPSYTLLLYSDNAQLVVLGSRRRNAPRRVFLGSTSLDLLHHCRVPVVLCPLLDQDMNAEH